MSSSLAERAYRYYRVEGFRTTIREALELLGRRIKSYSTAVKVRFPYYFRFAYAYHYRRTQFNTEEYPAPLDPFKLVWVDPDRITKHTTRMVPYENRKFGLVKGGDWDRRDEFRYASGFDDVERFERKYPTVYFEDMPLYKAVRQRFVHGTDWRDTEYVKMLVEKIEENGKANRCYSIADLERKCNQIDELYRSIKEHGYMTQEQLLKEGKQAECGSFSEIRSNEIKVDVTRDGELLFVPGGRHRLSIAKVLNLDEVPIVFICRHEKWMEYRNRVYERKEDVQHPDFYEFKGQRCNFSSE